MEKVEQLVSTNLDSTVTPQEKFSEIFRQIGIHFINNAERLGNNATHMTSNIDVFISLEPNSVVYIDITQREPLAKQGLSENVVIGKLAIEPETNMNRRQ